MTTKIVGILNITPDSFSDGGKFNQENTALAHLKTMLNEQADMIDVGAESTRPGAVAISVGEEIKRLENILPLIVKTVKDFNKKVELSIDSRNLQTAQMAYEMGFDVINDVSGLKDEAMIEFIAKNKIKTVFMHSLSVPANHNIIVNAALNVTKEILDWAEEKINSLTKKGIKKSQLIFDPGVGFSKNQEQSLRIVKNIAAFKDLGLPLYVGHSKKRFLDILNIEGMGNEIKDRDKKTLIISAYLASKKVDYIRVHDVLENINYIKNYQNSFNF